jgi:hypothetical protein
MERNGNPHRRRVRITGGSRKSPGWEAGQRRDPDMARGCEPDETRGAERDLHGVFPSRDHGGASRRGPSANSIVRRPQRFAQDRLSESFCVPLRKSGRVLAAAPQALAPPGAPDISYGAGGGAVLCSMSQGTATS